MLKIAIFCLSVIFTAPSHMADQTTANATAPSIDPIVTGVSISQSEKDAWADRRAKHLAQVASGAVESQDFPE